MTAGGADRRERLLWFGLVAVAAALRLLQLGERPYHHDESIHAWFSNQLASRGEYAYDPVYHGPVQYLMVASAFRLLGTGDVTARLPAALGGTALVALAWMLRERFGRRAAFLAGGLLALSPVLLYFTRFCREDVWNLLGTAGALLWFERWVRERRPRQLAYSALFLAVAFAAKENFYVFLALLVPAVAAAVVGPVGGRVRPWDLVRKLIDQLENHSYGVAGACLLFFVVGELLYTLALIHPESGNPAWTAIAYWWGQHKQERVGGPKSYYLPRILQYEFAIVVPALIWIWHRRRELDPVRWFLAGLGISSLAMYAYLGEKTPWLIVHQVLPFVPLAAEAWAAVLASTRTWLRGVGGAVALASGASALALSFWNAALTPARDVAESVIYVQTSPEMRDLAREIRGLRAAGNTSVATVQGEAAWPLNWYLRDLAVEWSAPTSATRSAFVITDESKAEEAAAALGPGYRRSSVPLRVWWVPEASARPLVPDPRALLRYLVSRKPWSPIGSQDVVVFRRGEGK